MDRLKHVIRSVLKDRLKIRHGETVIILADTHFSELANNFYEETKLFSRNHFLLIIPEITAYCCDLPRHVSSFITKADVLIILTSRFLSNTTRNRTSQRGTRIITLSGITEETILRTFTVDYKYLAAKSRKIADILTIGRSAHLTTPAGTDLTFSLLRMRGYADTGTVHEPGQFTNLPAGEACITPVHGTAEGILVIDGSFPEIGKIDTPIRMTVKKGRVVRIIGGDETVKVRALLRRFGKCGKNIAEIGVGTNPEAKLTGCIREDTKVLGTVHVAFGNNVSFGGKVSAGCHLDGVLLNSTLVIDTKTVVENGILQV